jgi:7-carboxy-7-deazaguanine synthase
VDYNPPHRMRITEIYKSIQGESTYAGLPCVFVRTTGCDLRCSWCDSEFTFTGGTTMTVDEVLAEVERLDCRLVELTGGEPMLQKDIDELARRLCDAGHTVLIETGGHRDVSAAALDGRVVRVMDVKCPGSGESHRNHWENLAHLRPSDEVKFVLASREDYEWARDLIRREGLDRRARVLMSVAFREVSPADAVRWILEDGLDVRFQLQMHKFIWDPDARRV